MTEPTIKINPSKPCELEFDVTIQGSDEEKPVVRFVMSGCEGYDCMFPCEHIEGSKWRANLPVLTHFTKPTVHFRVEVIIDGYYFEPADGTVQMMTDPSVKVSSKSSKPKVATSFTVKQRDDKKPVEEASGGGEVTAQYAPTNRLLTPEYEPPQGSVKTAQAEKDDQQIDLEKLASIASSVTPGESTDPTPDVDLEDFDPKSVAEAIVKNTVGGVQRPTRKGSLFERDSEGRPVVRGLDKPHTKALKQANAAKVKQILGSSTT